MKLLKIGSSSSCDIVLHSEFVSSHHAEMILLDSGEIILEDKNSTNGTFVGNKKINPNTEVTVRRGDYIRFADVELQWAHVPVLENSSKYKSIINIGTNFRNDIVITGNYPSRFHAVLKVTKDNKAFITDLGSRNGTKVNGVKLQSGKDMLVRKGDSVICGDVDVTDQIAPFIPNRFGWLKGVGIGVGAAAAIVILGLLVRSIIMPSVDWTQEYQSSVVYVDACYHYKITFEDCPIHPDIWDGVIEDTKRLHRYSGTAFFLDREGRMATNRHVAVPWEYADENNKKDLQNEMEEFLLDQLRTDVCVNEDHIQILKDTKIGSMILEQALKTNNYTPSGITSLIRKMKKCRYTVTGVPDYITVGYPGRNYTHRDEYERCFVLKESGTNDLDIALLQLNTKKTPVDVKRVFDVSQCITQKLEPQKDELVWIGYPRGNLMNLDEKIHSLDPNVRNTRCSRPQSKYTFEFQGEVLGGASGSPIFNKKNGKLVGVLWGGWRTGSTFGLACQARYLKEMYEEEMKGYE